MMKTPKEFLNNLNLYDGNNDHFKNAHAIYKTSQLMDMYAKEYHQEQLKLLNIDDVSSTVGLEDAKKVLLRYDQAIKEEIAVKLEWLRDHGTHAEFCDIITDIRENVLDTYR